jgi:hypothetical protein
VSPEELSFSTASPPGKLAGGKCAYTQPEYKFPIHVREILR